MITEQRLEDLRNEKSHMLSAMEDLINEVSRLRKEKRLQRRMMQDELKKLRQELRLYKQQYGELSHATRNTSI